MKLTLAQIEVEAADIEGNRRRAESAIERAASQGVDLVALPEIFNVGYFAFDVYERYAEPLEGETLTRIADAAADHGIGVIAGSIVEDLGATETASTPAESGLANTTVFFDREGNRQGIYRKRHLFGYDSAEAEFLVPGERDTVVEFEGFDVGMTTCYDLRFPEQFRRLTEAGATLVVVPSAWPYPRVEHWETLSRARAIENQQYVATVNGAGSFDDTTLLGRSTVYDPWGTTLASSDDEPALVTAEIESDVVERVREEFPALRDRRQ
ncbi:carbon-nitrogen family hydrolase [Natranaeroarchaeum aerophilus]|uniref:Carbon-nitrogen family hydrolase n=1 Tax=Natranaeroarchaeum aerophilus TaxID=2917711 RepID=A0AAE3FRK9_9EURY|nr:carbon-nitrogen family hydrolase [Natranaeroarchaeum aerophilus]MCL9814307.1 carbon-nitrogen family hydrolase [Natranaeroarchaeum aerophilus]